MSANNHNLTGAEERGAVDRVSPVDTKELRSILEAGTLSSYMKARLELDHVISDLICTTTDSGARASLTHSHSESKILKII